MFYKTFFCNSICRPNWRAGRCTQGFPTAGLSTASNRETESVRARRPKPSFAPGARTTGNVASLSRSIRERVPRQVLKIQETLIFRAQLASMILLSQPSMHRCSSHESDRAPSARAFTAPFACIRFSLCAGAQNPAGAVVGRAPDEMSRPSPLSLFGHAQNKGVAILPSRPPDFVSSHYLNLSLAARRCVGHIGLNGDVAEWLKAAVC